MLLRKDARGVLAIGQPSHAWLSGQLARAWGNAKFGTVFPFEEVCLAAEQHDVGMAAWDLVPPLNSETGFPQSFLEMPLGAHMLLWRLGPRRMCSQSRYAAVLVSMHGARLYQRRDLRKLPEHDAQAVRSFLGEQRSFQEQLLATLRADPATAEAASPEVVTRNSDLVMAWDELSLALCLNWAPHTVKGVPGADGAVELQLRTLEDGVQTLEPWPLRTRAVTVSCEGQRLDRPVSSDEALQQALANGPWETVRFELRSA